MKLKLKKPFLIGEIGINHNGSIDLTKKLIESAASSGFDAVKFQKRDPDISTPEEQKLKLRQTPWGEMTYLDYKKKIEFGDSEFNEIDKFCKKKKIIWFASAWDAPSQKFLKKYKLKYNKVASAMLTNINLIEKIAEEKKLTLISTGMSTIKDISKAVNIFRKKKCKFVLMHCVSTYPCPIENLNLNLIQTLKKKFKCEVGYSGHESSVSPSVIAYMMGATYIERHITLDRSMWGTDQAASLSESGMKNLSDILNKAQYVVGDGIKRLSKQESDLLKKFKYWK
jgi:N-acetylneuraminate synthase